MERTVLAIHSELDSLQQVHAPDLRLAVWEMDVADSAGALLLKGKVDRAEALEAVDRLIAGRFPDVRNRVELLPEDPFAVPGSGPGSGPGGGLVNGMVNNSVANLRREPGHRAEIVTQALLGTPVRILEKEGEWYRVQLPTRYLGWVDEAAIEPVGRDSLAQFRNKEKVVFSNQYGFAYSRPDEDAVPVSDLVVGCLLASGTGRDGFLEVCYPDGRKGWVRKDAVVGIGELIAGEPEGTSLVESAKRYMGVPYLWGGTSAKGLDCSGYTSLIFYMHGILLQRDADQQSRTGEVITTRYESGDLRPGDLLFYGRPGSDSLAERVTHVAMYTGDTEFIHASGKVKINSMDSTRNNYIPEYRERFVRAVRLETPEKGERIQRIPENPFYREILKSAQ